MDSECLVPQTEAGNRLKKDKVASYDTLIGRMWRENESGMQYNKCH